MQNLVTCAIATAALLLAAPDAGAFSVTATTNWTPSPVLGISDTITVNVYVDAPESGLQFFSLSVVA